MTTQGLTVEVEDGDYTVLVGIMGHLLSVRDRTAATGNSVQCELNSDYLKLSYWTTPKQTLE